jgi:adenine-specific DNA-methyltransferase
VIERIIKSTSNPGDLILDPFMGSGTTAEVALRLGRKVVGFEIREDYCRIIQARLTTPKETKKKQRKRKRVDPSQNE